MISPHLSERIEPNAPEPRAEGRFIIYWMRIAQRAFENPALDVALELGRSLDKPVFVYQGLSQRYRYASDRLHTFILEGAREAHAQLRERGIGSVFHLERGSSEPVLLHLAKQAALVVCDAMPVEPMLRWDLRVSAVAPLWRVDASCVAPMWGFQNAVERAATFREMAQPVWRERLLRPWPLVEPSHLAFVPEVPFTPLDLERESIADLVASCDIDHSIGPVHHTPGGTTAAEQRWARFRDDRLDAYASSRHDPVAQGTSRLSAYLHFGQLSVFTIAREAFARRTAGADKYLDELLTWRELAWHFCLHRPNHETLDALPGWARRTLLAHEKDPRPRLFSYEQLARAQTQNPLWDACQRSLLTQGELHNSARMTWAKAVLTYTRTPREALQVLIDLNHRYALDGRDPASILGILWCLGAFDRSFLPEQPILGQVRSRPLDEQAQRLDVAEFGRRTRRASRQPLTVAIVGAGVSGAAAARALTDAGHIVTVFDKGRAPGGRCSTRHEANFSFDHGAQRFTVRDERFARWARSLWVERVLAEWKPRLIELGGAPQASPTRDVRPAAQLVATPGMGSLVSRLLSEIDVRSSVEVGALVFDAGPRRWRLASREGHALGEFEALVVSAPAPQSAALLDAPAYSLAARLREVKMAPCWAMMAAFDASLGLEWDAAVSHIGPLAWLARDSHKPERNVTNGERWVFHASPTWSQRHLDDSPESVAAQLLDAFRATTGVAEAPRFFVSHRWRYATTLVPLGDDCLFDATLQLAVCGDWCRAGEGVESAFLSGQAAAGRLLGLTGPLADSYEVPTRKHPAQLRLID